MTASTLVMLVLAVGLPPRSHGPESRGVRAQPQNLKAVPDWALDHGTQVGWLGETLAIARIEDPFPNSRDRGQPRFWAATFDDASGRWNDIPPPPMPLPRWSEYSIAFVGQRLLIIQNAGDQAGSGALFDVGQRSWTRFDAPPGLPHDAFRWRPYRGVSLGHRWVWFPIHKGTPALGLGFILDTRSATWTRTASDGAPPDTGYPRLEVLDDDRFLTVPVKGQTVAIFDAEINRWTSAAFRRPPADLESLAVSPGGCGAVALGWSKPDAERRRTLSVWTIDLDSLEVEQLPSPELSFDHYVNNTLVAFDGERIVIVDRKRVLHYELGGDWQQMPVPSEHEIPNHAHLQRVCGKHLFLSFVGAWLLDGEQMTWSEAPGYGNWPRDAAKQHLLFTPTWNAYVAGASTYEEPYNCPPGAPCAAPEEIEVRNPRVDLLRFCAAQRAVAARCAETGGGGLFGWGPSPGSGGAGSGAPSSPRWELELTAGLGLGWRSDMRRLSRQLERVSLALGSPADVSFDNEPLEDPIGVSGVTVSYRVSPYFVVGVGTDLVVWDDRVRPELRERLLSEFGVEPVQGGGLDPAVVARIGPRFEGRLPLAAGFAARLNVAGGMWARARGPNDLGLWLRPGLGALYAPTDELIVGIDAGYNLMPAFGDDANPLRGFDLRLAVLLAF